ncbi:MAG TPA: peptidylprolyl isomerase [Myxococcota bacterium]|nr:peptidylprolyl isomerase [Myxococcota bacterium]
MRTTWILLAFGLVACDGNSTTAPTSTTTSAADIGEVLATVDGLPVGSVEFELAASRVSPDDGKSLSLEERKDILDRLVNDKVLYLEALRRGLDKDPKVQKVMVNTLLRDEVYANVRNSDFTDEELRAHYEANKEDFVVPEKVQVKRILIQISDDRPAEEALAIAESVRAEIASDPKGLFKDAATKHSEDPYRRRGGDVGFVSAEGKPGLDQDIVDVAFSLDVEELSGVFESADGYNILYIANKRERVERTFQQMKGSVLRKVKNDKLKEMYESYVASLKDGVSIQINEDKLAALDVKTAVRPSIAPEFSLGPGADNALRPSGAPTAPTEEPEAPEGGL